MNYDSQPTIKELGLDLMVLPKWKLGLTIVEPLIFFVLYIALAFNGAFAAATLAVVAMSYFTYGSTSHDLVHNNLRLKRGLNDFLLSFLELISLRSGTAYRLSHLNHHRSFPHEDDIEGKAAAMTLIGSLVEGFIFQFKIVIWALENAKLKDKRRIILELIILLMILIVSIVLIPFTLIPIYYVILQIMGSWIIPFVTSYLVHNPEGDGQLLQTKLFRGKFYSIISLEHLYHLEHHMYPMVPHKNWPELARRLNPYFEQMNIKPHRVF